MMRVELRACALAAVLWAGATVGCLPQTAALICDDGTLCATPRVCAPAGGACVDAEQVAACKGAGLADGEDCALGGVGAGQCRAGVCVVAGCGDGIVDLGEACDDGNELDGDACTSDCSLPTCGDGVTQGDEGCDDGAANGDDRACTSRCLPASCGDALVLAGIEECDAGVGNSDSAPCTTACTRAVCGDGHVFAGVEPCDDGPSGAGVSGDGCRADCRKVEVCGDGLLDTGEACDDSNGNVADGCDACAVTAWQASTLVGGTVAATSSILSSPSALTIDRDGNLYVAGGNRILRVSAATGSITAVVGTGTAGSAGDGGAATSALLRLPAGVAVDGLGNLLVADTDNHRIRRVAAVTGVITTVVGTGTAGDGGDGSAATSALLRSPAGIAVDGLGNLFIADTLNHRVRRVDATTGVITTLAGTGVGGFGGDGNPATTALLLRPAGIAVDALGRVYFSDSGNHRIRRVDVASGLITTVAGMQPPVCCGGGFGGDGGAATSALLATPKGVALDSVGNLYISDTSNNRLRRVDVASGFISTVAGTGPMTFGGDGAAATGSQLAFPQGVALDSLGNIYVADSFNRRVRRVDAVSTIITTVAGGGGDGGSGDGGAATGAALAFPRGVALDGQGNVFIADTDNRRIRRVAAANGVISTMAGTGTPGYGGDGAAATSALLSSPYSIARDALGNLYVADTYDNRIRRVAAATGVITTIAGTGTPGAGVDGIAATSSQVAYPYGLAADAAGNVYIADSGTDRIRKVDAASGIITTVAGTGTWGFSGDGAAAIDARLNYPQGVAVDAQGNLYIADTYNHRIRRVDVTTGFIDTVAGTGVAGYGGDNGAAISALLRSPTGVAVDGLGNFFVADTLNNRIRRVAAVGGVITTVAGTGVFGDGDGDGGAATSADVGNPWGVAVDALGNLYVADTGSGRIRRVDAASQIITTVAGPVDPGGMGPLGQARLADPRAMTLAPSFTLFAGGVSGTLQAIRPLAALLEVVAGRYPQLTAGGNSARFRDYNFGAIGGVAFDEADGVIYLTESTANRIQVVTVVDPTDEKTWTIAPLANAAGTAGFGDGAGDPLAAQFRGPTGLYFDDATRLLYVADTGNHVVRSIDLSAGAGAGTVATIAGTPATLGYFGDGAAATASLLFRPQAITRCGSGDLMIADTGNHRVRRIAATSGVVTTVLGDGVAASSGEGAPAATFPVDAPVGLACDAAGNLYVSSTTTIRFLPAAIALGESSGVVDGSGAVQSIYGAPPRDTFPASSTSCLTGVAVVDADTVQVTDSCTGFLVELWRQPAP